MKKIRMFFRLFVLVLVMLNTCSILSFAEDEPNTNLIASYDFESNYQGWVALGSKSNIFINKEKGYSGSACLSTKSRIISWSGPSVSVADMVIPDTDIFAQAFVISDNENGDNIAFSVKCVKEDGSIQYDDLASAFVENDKWTLLEGTYHIPEDMSTLTLYFQTTEGTQDFSIDDVKIYGQHKEQLISEYESNDGKEYSFDFEKNLNGWVPRGSTSIMATSAYSYKGSYSLYASDRKEFWNAPSVRLNNIVKGIDYNYSAYVMYNGEEYEDNHYFALKLQYSLNGKEVYSEIANKKLHKGTWSKISGDFSIPVEAENVLFYIQTDDVDITKSPVTENDLMSFYVDNVIIFDNTESIRSRFINMIIISIVSAIGGLLIIFIIWKIIKKIRLTRQAIISASMDAMTKTFNRNTYEKHLDTLESNPEKCKKVYVTVCDVNFLKYINDNYGHEAGDKAIIRCAEVLNKVIGKKGKVYRTGGDEFMCITKSDMTNSLKSEFSIESSKYRGYPFSVAVGTAHYDSDIDFSPDIKAILKRSDAEMYKHKQEIKKFMHDFSKEDFIVKK